jgi:hypothetical protein
MSHHLFPWREPFLEALRALPVVQAACDAVGIQRSTAYRARLADPDLAEAWDDAMEAGIDRAEQEAFRRGMLGFEEPVIDRGRLVYRYTRRVDAEGKEHYDPVLDANGQPVPLTVRKHSDAMLALILKGRRKQTYAERRELTGKDGEALPAAQVVIATGVPDDDAIA